MLTDRNNETVINYINMKSPQTTQRISKANQKLNMTRLEEEHYWFRACTMHMTR